MSDPANTTQQNILPVQALFNVDNTFNTFIGQGQPFYATISPSQSGLNITNSTINSTTIGATTPSSAAFTTATVSTAPVNGTDVVNKTYLEYFAAGISWKQPVLCATTANITLSGLQTLDGVTVASGDRVLVKNQSTASQNGIYLASASTWTRAPDADVWTDLISALVFIETGTTLTGSAWYCSAQPGGTLGTTAVNWSNFSVAASYSAGTGLTLNSYQFSITNTGVTAGAYGSASKTLTATVNAQGQLTVLAATDIAIANTQVSGLGTMSTQNANAVAITGGTISGLSSPIPVASGGTGASTLTGYVKGSGTLALSASATIPTTDLSGTITNAQLQNSTISGISLGSNLATLTIGSGLSGTSYNGSTAVTITNSSPMVYPSSGIPSSTGTGWNSSYSTTGSGSVLALATAPTLNNPTVSNYQAFTGSTAPTYAAGLVWYDSTYNALSYYNNTTNNVVHIGQELQQQVRNSTGSTISKGQIVYISGATGQIGNITLAQANAYTTSQVIGVANQDIANNTNGWVVTQGTITNFNTAGLTEGASVYLSATTAGAFTSTEPSTPNYAVHMGTCLYSNASNGKIYISPINKSIDTGYIIGQVAIGQGGTNGTATPVAGAVAYGTGTAYAFTAAGTSGQVLQSNGTSAPTWVTPAAYATVTDDTTTNATRYPLFANVTTGNLTTEYVSSTKLQYNPSTGNLGSTSFNKVTITAPATGSTLTITDGKTLSVNNTVTLTGTDSTSYNLDALTSIPQNSQSAAYTLVLSDAGKQILHPSTDNNARTFTIPANSSVAYPVGTTLTFVNMINTVTIAINTDTMYLSSAGTTGSRTLAAYGVATAVKLTSTTWLISGNGLT